MSRSPTLTRRRFLAALLAASASARYAAAAERGGLTIRHLLASSLFGQEPVEAVLPQVAATGSEAIDLWPKVHGAQREAVDAMGVAAFNAMCREADVRVGCLTRYDLGTGRLRPEIGVAKALGADMLVSGPKSPKAVAAKDLKAEVGKFVKATRPLVAAAEEAGVTVAVENHRRNLFEAADSLRYLRDLRTSPNLAVALAPAHLPQDPASVAALVRDLGGAIAVFYAWERGDDFLRKTPTGRETDQLPGVGAFDFAPVVDALAAVGYAGWTSVFMHPVPRGVPAAGSVAETTAAVNRSLAHLRGLAGRA